MNRRRGTVFAYAAYAALIGALWLTGAGACKNGQRMNPGASAAQVAAPTVVVRTDSGRLVPFRVELARTEAERELGLMYRQQMAPEAGMLFLFDRSAPLTFWMKNTFIPLDMIFIDDDRRIIGIVENAEPRTLTARRVEGSARYVLEINGGLSAKLGIKAGAGVDFRDIPAD